MGCNSRAIVLTPPGASAITVIRLTGSLIRPFLLKFFSNRMPPASRCVHGELRDGDHVLDDPVVVLAPNESWADVNVHGGAWVVRSVLDLAAREGFEVIDRLAAPLPAEAVDAEGEIEREVLQYLPLARTELALRVLLAQPVAWERVADYDASSILADQSLDRLLHPPRVAIVGVPNVGKSTLANQLFGQERSITADLPGTTRDWVGELANVDGLAVMLVDTPGLRETADPIEREAMDRAAGEVRTAELVVLVLDVTQPLEGQRELMERYPDAIRVVNKVDLAGAWRAEEIEGIRAIARTGEGVNVLRRKILSTFGCHAIELNRPRCWTPRQREPLLIAKRNAPSPQPSPGVPGEGAGGASASESY
jgi:tRNA modification GTPase